MSALHGKRIVVTRPRESADATLALLEARGAQPILLPAIEFSDVDDHDELDRAIMSLRSYDWVVFTSATGVRAFWKRLAALNLATSAFEGVAVAAVGPATATALRERGVDVRFVPDEYVADALAAGLGHLRGRRVLLPRADIARKAIVEELRDAGAIVDDVAVYRTVPAQASPAVIADILAGVDAVLFTSSSTVRSFHAQVGAAPGAVIACIGPITAQTAAELGYTVSVQPQESTTEGLIEALEMFYVNASLEAR